MNSRQLLRRITFHTLVTVVAGCTLMQPELPTVQQRMDTELHASFDMLVLPPPGHLFLCERNAELCVADGSPSKQLVLTEHLWQELYTINNFVNQSVPQLPDMDNYGRPEYWSLPNERGGDCEDLALLKQKLLIDRGLPGASLLLATARDWKGRSHALLMVVTDRGDYVLDNLDWAIRLWSDTAYLWLKRQSSDNPREWLAPAHVTANAHSPVPGQTGKTDR